MDVIPPTTCNPPCIARVSIGEEEFMPTFPFVKIRNKLAPVLEAISNGFVPPVPCKAREAIGEDVLIPTLPFVKTVNIEVEVGVEETIENGLAVPSA
mgnify:CR=1 FL=1